MAPLNTVGRYGCVSLGYRGEGWLCLSCHTVGEVAATAIPGTAASLGTSGSRRKQAMVVPTTSRKRKTSSSFHGERTSRQTAPS
eukprot:scaffold2369_cov101-Isochrysis_galbana.AAC.1